jgi:Na+/proline symporter
VLCLILDLYWWLFSCSFVQHLSLVHFTQQFSITKQQQIRTIMMVFMVFAGKPAELEKELVHMCVVVAF